MLKYINIFFTLILLFSSSWGYGQIVNDSVQNIYGTHSTKYFLEEDILKNNTYRKLDTILLNFHRYNYVQRNEYTYQDLGNPGTAMKSLYYLSPSTIGFRSGYKQYALYVLKPSDVKYYDTKSPYTRLYYAQSTRRISFLEGEFSRNINPSWNAGFTLRRVVSNRQIGTSTRTNEREVDHMDFSIFTAFKTKNDFYRILACYTHTQHNVSEPGGVKRELINFQTDIFNYGKTVKELQNATSNQWQMMYHLYHHIRLFPELQFYHQLDYNREIIRFGIVPPTQSIIYPTPQFRKDSTSEETEFRTVENQLGLKGNIDSIHFYRIYFKQRNYKIINLFEPNDQKQDKLIGGELTIRFSKNSYVNLSGEYLLQSSITSAKNYLGKLSYQNKFFFLNYQRSFYGPSYLENSHTDNHFKWQNDFKSSLSDYAEAGLNIDLTSIQFKPSIKASLINNYIYFGTDSKPHQDYSTITLLHPTTELNFHIKRFHLLTKGIYTIQQGSDVIRIPQLMANSCFYYEQHFKKKKLVLQTGLDAHYQSSFLADSYMPVTQQFFLQDSFLVNNYYTIDWFANVLINKVRVFGKVPYINMGLTDDNGYSTTPYYFGERQAFVFGVCWMGFD